MSYLTDCNYFRIVNYNNVQIGYYKWTGCTGIISVSQVNPLQYPYQETSWRLEAFGVLPLPTVNVFACP